ncbi:DUF3693 domain-containing protein [Stenotrophomonas indicatrix]|uniref:DUF3693 domain-containing protein n=1 Tax=Stenotrophomonas indicatrix TaxID=2045451 RepID=UPI0028AC80AE|nr:DUF3693 domain-containing protein [Stenotrophomonas indicatrix]
MDVNSLLDQAKEACGVSYDKDLAPRLGVRPSAISNYRKGVSHPDAVVCATLAGLTGVPLARVLGVIGEARAISREEKAVWRKLAATAMALCLAVGFALPHKAQAAVAGFDSAHAVYIMRNATCLAQAPPLGRFRTKSSVIHLVDALRILRERRLGAGVSGPDAESSNVVHMSRGPRPRQRV